VPTMGKFTLSPVTPLVECGDSRGPSVLLPCRIGAIASARRLYRVVILSVYHALHNAKHPKTYGAGYFALCAEAPRIMQNPRLPRGYWIMLYAWGAGSQLQHGPSTVTPVNQVTLSL
jgi:hypothetical protein